MLNNTIDTPRAHAVRASTKAQPHQRVAIKDFLGIWKSEGGSLYTFDSHRFVCIAVHDAEFRGWIGQCAVKSVHTLGPVCTALQAFRYASTGTLIGWVPITISLNNDIVTKYFPNDVPSHHLVYGHTERYVRVSQAVHGT